MGSLRVIASGNVQPHADPAWDALVSPADKRRSPRIWQLASTAAARALTGTELRPRALVSATALGALDETRLFLDRLFSENLGSPRNFVASVHNSMAGKLALDLGIQGPNLTLCDSHNSLAAAVAAAQLLDEADLPVLIVAVDENTALIEQLTPYFSAECQAVLARGWKDGAVAFLCDRGEGGPRIDSLGPAPKGEASAQQACALLAAPITAQGAQLLQLAETCTSFLQPALVAEQLLREKRSCRYAIPSYAPTCETVAVLDLCA
jgi:hypothetical protein